MNPLQTSPNVSRLPLEKTNSNGLVTPAANNAEQQGNQPINDVPNQKIVPERERLGKLGEIFSEKDLKRMGIIECSTCASRTYQDESDDSGVSFQAPTHLSPGQAAAAVSSHEQEHVVREQAAAEEDNREVISQSVQIHTAICPECGRSYVSGGTTTTTTQGKTEKYSGRTSADYVGNLVDKTF